ncbi:DUF5597 domain-containing protein [Pedobacter sp. P351]|uniref:GH35 family beta-galactosidase n=1 Tax=Pedobacter superstes TaxID=3133441 RepID=UPI00309E6648
MKLFFKNFTIFNFILIAFCLNANSQEAPHLEKRGKATQLIVDGKPYLVLGGELHNSSSSNLDYLNPLWQPLKQMNLNTALVAVSWELIEPQEGKFDFSLVDGILSGARENNMRVILLWFGSWKNGLSHYSPEWVKKDYKRFPRIVLENGRSTETISALGAASAKADAKAFAALMRHLKTVDSKKKTVIMVQVENEVGVIGGTRDHSSFANSEFAKPVPEQLLESIRKNKTDLQPSLKKLLEAAGSKTKGTWTEVFGNNHSADEAFMAWNYAKYINSIAEAGKAEYNIPMFVNAWIVQPEDKKPGDYPGGGPQAHVHDIWRAGAPAIDFLSPDIYLPDTKRITKMYHHSWNPLFIPESFSGENGAANAFYVIGFHDAIGYSPFGIDNKVDEPSKTPIAKAYNVLRQLTPEITAAQADGAISGFSLDKVDSVQTASLGGYKITVTLRKNWSGVTQVSKGYGLVINTGPDAFTVAGSDIDVTFVPLSPGPKMAGLSWVREGVFEDGKWKQGRLLNGDNIMISYKLADEAHAYRTGTGARLTTEPGILKIKLYRFE